MGREHEVPFIEKSEGRVIDNILTAGNIRPSHNVRLVVLGGNPASIPSSDIFTLSNDPELGFDIALLAGPVAPSELWDALQAGNALLAPVVDFSGQQGSRHDASFPSLTAASLREALLAVKPILRRVVQIGDISDLPDRDRWYALGMAYTRQKEIAAAWTSAVPHGVCYPLLGMHPLDHAATRSLADLGLLERTFFGRTNACTRCASSRLNAFETCGKCGSANLQTEQLAHHYACGAQGPESAFFQGERLVCPKCRKELKHIGVDYDRPGAVSVCVACKEVTADPDVTFACLDCGQSMPSADARTADWFSYRITPEGTNAIKAGRLPNLDIVESQQSHSGTLSVRDFVLIARNEFRVATRYKRAFTLVRLTIEDREALRMKHGGSTLDDSLRFLVRLIAETLRDSDIVTGTSQHEIFIALPETDAEQVRKILERLQEKIRTVMTLPLNVVSSIGEGSDAEEILAACR